jgi:hypothetical protein
MITRLTSGPLHHFFGYYGMQPWNSTGQYHLALETSFHDRAPTPTDIATIGYVDTGSRQFNPVAETRAFNLQQGSMLNWIDVGFGEELTYNDWEGDRLLARAVNRVTGETRTIDAPISAVHPRQPVAFGANYARAYVCRRVVGYAHTLFTRNDLRPIPDDDGLFRLDLRTGKSELLFSLVDVEKLVPYRPDPDLARYAGGAGFNANGSRLTFGCRTAQPATPGTGCGLICDLDGRNLECYQDYGESYGRKAWFSSDKFMTYGEYMGKEQYVWINYRTRSIEPCNIDGFPKRGHMAFSPDRGRVVTDCGVKEDPEGRHGLVLHDLERRQTSELGRFTHPENIKWDWRCDLHPRWSRDGKQISFDSCHEETRQIYIVDV